MVHTYGSALRLIGVTVPQHLSAEAEVAVLTGPQAQGDLLVLPVEATPEDLVVVPAEGAQLVQGEATGNTHWLHRGFDSPGVAWRRCAPSEPAGDPLGVAHLRVPPGQTALLIHTDEHGANGIGPGQYLIKRKRQADPAAPSPGHLRVHRLVAD